MENVFLLAFIKFAILGTAGEVIGKLIIRKKFKLWNVFYSALVWGILGIIIKFCFTGFSGFTSILIERGWLPDGFISRAFFMSFFTNAMFGPWVIILHRLLDSLPFKKFTVPKEGIRGALFTLLWFWLPAHTITFALPEQYQITLAAIWSLVLGLILSIFNKSKLK